MPSRTDLNGERARIPQSEAVNPRAFRCTVRFNLVNSHPPRPQQRPVVVHHGIQWTIDAWLGSRSEGEPAK